MQPKAQIDLDFPYEPTENVGFFLWIDALILFLCLLANSILDSNLILYLLIFYMIGRLSFSSIVDNFALLMMLIPNIGIMYVTFSGIYIPVLNILICYAMLKVVVALREEKFKFTYFLILLLFISYEWLHAWQYELSSLPLLFSWTAAIMYVAFFLFYTLNNYNHWKIITYFLAGLIVSIMMGVLEFYGRYGTLMSDDPTIRFNGGAGDANYFSMYIMIGLFCLVFMISKNNSPFKSLMYTFLFLGFFAFGFLSLSRMFLLVVTAMLLLLIGTILISLRRKKKIFHFLFSVGFLVSLSFLYFYEKIIPIIELSLSRFTNFLKDPSMLTSNRNIIAEEYLQLMLDSVGKTIFGIGIQDYSTRSGIFLETHNIVLELFVVWGVLGVIVFVLFLVGMFKLIAKKPINKTNLINWLPILSMGSCYLSLNALSNESFFLLLAFSIKHIYEN